MSAVGKESRPHQQSAGNNRDAFSIQRHLDVMQGLLNEPSLPYILGYLENTVANMVLANLE